MADLAELEAVPARERLLRGEISAVQLAEACLARIDAREPAVGAWIHLDRNLVIAQAEAADARRKSGRPVGPLNGLPVGVKDIIDTAGLPTENGTVIDRGRRPRQDAAVVARLRAAGAVVMGKTVTTELAYFQPAGTRNPHDPERTPGGSSSGSAAAVAAAMVPLAIGSQTAGSTIRPASFCGVVGFKPSHGLIPRTGILTLAPALDTVGVFARSVEDAALLADALAGHDPADADTMPAAPPQLLETALKPPPVKPDLAFVKSPAWKLAEPGTDAAFAELVAALGDRCIEVELPEVYNEGAAAQRTLMLAGFARHLRTYHQRSAEGLSETMYGAIEEGRRITAIDYLSALDWQNVLATGLDRIFERFDAIITPAAPGEAPKGLGATGSPAFNVLWTLTGVPAVTLPLLVGPNGLPLGVQLVGRKGYDGRLLRTARWLVEFLSDRT